MDELWLVLVTLGLSNPFFRLNLAPSHTQSSVSQYCPGSHCLFWLPLLADSLSLSFSFPLSIHCSYCFSLSFLPVLSLPPPLFLCMAHTDSSSLPGTGWGGGGLPEQAYPAGWGGAGQSPGEAGHCSAEARGGREGCRWEREVRSTESSRMLIPSNTANRTSVWMCLSVSSRHSHLMAARKDTDCSSWSFCSCTCHHVCINVIIHAVVWSW